MPGENRVHFWQHRTDAAFGLGFEGNASDVSQRFIRRFGTILSACDIVDADGCESSILPAAAIIHKEADILRRSLLAQVATIACRLLDRDGGFENVRGWVEPYARKFLECGVGNDLDCGFEFAGGKIAEMIWILKQQFLEAAP